MAQEQKNEYQVCLFEGNCAGTLDGWITVLYAGPVNKCMVKRDELQNETYLVHMSFNISGFFLESFFFSPDFSVIFPGWPGVGAGVRVLYGLWRLKPFGA